MWVGAAYAYRHPPTERRAAPKPARWNVPAASTRTVSAACGSTGCGRTTRNTAGARLASTSRPPTHHPAPAARRIRASLGGPAGRGPCAAEAAPPAARRQAHAPAGHRHHADPRAAGPRAAGGALLSGPGLSEQGTGRAGGRHPRTGGAAARRSPHPPHRHRGGAAQHRAMRNEACLLARRRTSWPTGTTTTGTDRDGSPARWRPSGRAKPTSPRCATASCSTWRPGGFGAAGPTCTAGSSCATCTAGPWSTGAGSGRTRPTSPTVRWPRTPFLLDQAVRRGARLQPVEADGIFVYVRHGANAWQFACGVTESRRMGARARAGLPARRARLLRRPLGGRPGVGAAPLVSCVMPTFDRRAFVPQAVRYFLRQDYPAKELVVIDDGPEPVATSCRPTPGSLPPPRVTGRSSGPSATSACELARGPVIVPLGRRRLGGPAAGPSVQVAALTSGGADICGAASLLYYDPAQPAAWRFTWPEGLRPWAAGPSLCFAKDLWTRSPVPGGGDRARTPASSSARPSAAWPTCAQPTASSGIIHRGIPPPSRPGPALEPPAHPRGGRSPR